MTDTAQLVIVANRLPVDRVDLPDGSTEWRRSPGGLVSALDPVMRANDGVWIGWAGGTQTDLEPFEEDGLSLVPVPLTRRGDRGLLRGHVQRHAVADLPRRRRQARVPPGLVGQLRHGQPPLRRPGGRGRRGGRDGLGPRLPAAAGAPDAARAAARPADRLLPPHPVPAGRAVRAAPVAAPDPRGAARRRPRRLPDERAAPATSSAWSGSGSATRPTATWSTCPTAAPSGRRRSRSRSTPPASRSWPAPRASTSARPRSARRWASPARSSSASTGSTTPRASSPGCAPSAS